MRMTAPLMAIAQKGKQKGTPNGSHILIHQKTSQYAFDGTDSEEVRQDVIPEVI